MKRMIDSLLFAPRLYGMIIKVWNDGNVRSLPNDDDDDDDDEEEEEATAYNKAENSKCCNVRLFKG